MSHSIYAGELYHAWQSEYKKPFGAVKAGNRVTFKVKKSHPAITSVSLLIHKDGQHEKQTVPMNQEVDEEGLGYFSVDYTLNEGSGLYFYRFQVTETYDTERFTYFLGQKEGSIGGAAYRYQEYQDCHDFQLTSFAKADPAPKWYQEGVIYHIFVDRFYNGNEDGSILNPKDNAMIYTKGADIPHYIKDDLGNIVRWDFYGGNLKGIIKKMDYLEKLGATILYLSPIFKARSNHKYDTDDYFAIDEMFGDMQTFEQLIEETNKRGMRLILDGVFNHTGAESKYFNQFNTYPELGAYQSKDSPYHDWYLFKEFPDDFDSWWGIKDLPKLDTDNPAVQDFVYGSKDSVIAKWSKTGIGGWRLDVADELSDEFLAGIRQTLEENALEKPVLIGEVWEDASNKVAYNQRRHYISGDMLHGVTNYPFRDAIIGFLNQEQTAEETAFTFLQLKENYPIDILKNHLNPIGSHDTVRIITALNGSNEKVKQAFAMLFTLPGVPTIYYGDEVGLEGKEDPDNRRPFPWGREDKNIQTFVSKWAKKRQEWDVLTQGDFHILYDDRCLYLLRVINQGKWLLTAINPSDKGHKVDWGKVENPSKIWIDGLEVKELVVPPSSYTILHSDNE